MQKQLINMIRCQGFFCIIIDIAGHSCHLQARVGGYCVKLSIRWFRSLLNLLRFKPRMVRLITHCYGCIQIIKLFINECRIPLHHENFFFQPVQGIEEGFRYPSNESANAGYLSGNLVSPAPLCLEIYI